MSDRRGAVDPEDGERRLDEVAAEFLTWAEATFPEATPASCVAHLRSELDELAATPDDPSELADAAMLVVHAAYRAGVDLPAAIRDKLEVNRAREWGPTNAEGFREHVPEGAGSVDTEGVLSPDEIKRLDEMRRNVQEPHSWGFTDEAAAFAMDVIDRLRATIDRLRGERETARMTHGITLATAERVIAEKGAAEARLAAYQGLIEKAVTAYGLVAEGADGRFACTYVGDNGHLVIYCKKEHADEWALPGTIFDEAVEVLILPLRAVHDLESKRDSE